MGNQKKLNHFVRNCQYWITFTFIFTGCLLLVSKLYLERKNRERVLCCLETEFHFFPTYFEKRFWQVDNAYID